MPKPSAPKPTSELIDFASTPLAPAYSECYAKIIDNIFTAKECKALIANAELSAPNGWEPAGIGMQGEKQIVYTDERNSDRIISFDDSTADMIWKRILPLISQDLDTIEPGSRWENIIWAKGTKPKKGEKWKMAGLNPCLRFLRYGPGNYFKPHWDGKFEMAEKRQTSFITIHLYLSDSVSQAGDLTGGETRFFSSGEKYHLDVEPKLGRVLVFQQRSLLHSGQEVKEGLKFTMRTDVMFEKISK